VESGWPNLTHLRYPDLISDRCFALDLFSSVFTMVLITFHRDISSRWMNVSEALWSFANSIWGWGTFKEIDPESN